MEQSQNKSSLEPMSSNEQKGSFFFVHHIDIPLLLGLMASLFFSLFVLYSASGQHIDNARLPSNKNRFSLCADDFCGPNST